MNTIAYSKPNVILYFLLGIVSFFLPLLVLLLNVTQPVHLVAPLFLVLIGWYFYYRIVKAVLHLIIKKPMIELTNEKYIDNLNGVNIKWKDVKFLSFEERKAPFVVFNLNQSSLFYSQMTNPLKRLFYKFEASYEKSFRTNIQFAKGKKLEIYKKIEEEYKKSRK